MTSTRPPLDLTPDAPHDPARTRALADTAARAVRALAYAADGPGLDGPADVYDLLGTLGELGALLPDLYARVARHLIHADLRSALEGTADRPDTRQAVTTARDALVRAGDDAASMCAAIGRAQTAIRDVRQAAAGESRQDDGTAD